jgi:TIR domain/SH2 domain
VFRQGKTAIIRPTPCVVRLRKRDLQNRSRSSFLIVHFPPLASKSSPTYRTCTQLKRRLHPIAFPDSPLSARHSVATDLPDPRPAKNHSKMSHGTAFSRAFGGSTAGPIENLAREISLLSGDHAALVSHVLRFTLVPWTEAQAASKACLANPLTVSLDLYQAWIARFGSESDEIAYSSAKALFATTPSTGAVALKPWYYGLTSPSAGSAQATLGGKPPGSFLLRISSSTPGSFALSYVVASGEIRHTRVHRVSGGYQCDGRTTLSATLPNLVEDLAAALTTPVASTLSVASAVTIPEAFATLAPVASADASDAYASYDQITTSPSIPLPPAAAPTTAAVAATPTTPALALSPTNKASAACDVMISYNWGNQPLCIRLKAALEKELGLSVWMDLSHMSQTYLSDMVSAVNNARCVILCVSEKYLKSENCLTEVNLVSEWRSVKPYIIAVLEEGLYPARLNHPIAILAAGRLFCSLAKAAADPTDEAAFQEGFENIKRQLIEKGIAKAPTPVSSPTPSTSGGGGAGASAGYVPSPLEKTPSVSTPMEAAAAPAPTATAPKTATPDSVAAALAGVSVS